MAQQFTKVEFHRFKAFKNFKIELRHFNILVGPNNAGKSTILAAFRILAAAMRRASAKKAELVRGPGGTVHGHVIDLRAISVAEENIFYNYDEDEPADVIFTISNGNKLILYFPERGVCHLILDAQGKQVSSPTTFKNHFDCQIGYVPILGPVEHHEISYGKEAARLALFSYHSARNFRNIWHHYPEKFEEFRALLVETWPGMDIQKPEVDRSHDKPRLHMFCPENRRSRELFWSGFGFQVWCQMLTHVIQSKDVSLFLIDEPDIYIHSELQRHLLVILRNLGPDILIATHSTEMITEAETEEIVLVNKGKSSAKRIKDPSQLANVFSILGSNLNPILTQLAKTRRVVFVEGKDFQILSKFARKLDAVGVGNRRDFAVVPAEGFNPERIRNLKAGMEATLGGKITAAAILDRDYRSKEECDYIKAKCGEFCDHVIIHERKEIENFLLVPSAIDRAVKLKMSERSKRSGIAINGEPDIAQRLNEFCESHKHYVTAQCLDFRKLHNRVEPSGQNESKFNEVVLDAVAKSWGDDLLRLNLVPGKDALSDVNGYLQDAFGVSITPVAIIDAMKAEEIPNEMKELIATLVEFSGTKLVD